MNKLTKLFVTFVSAITLILSSISPSFAKGAFGLIGYNSDEEVLYGVGYKCSDSVKLSSELSGDGDTSFRVSYSF